MKGPDLRVVTTVNEPLLKLIMGFTNKHVTTDRWEYIHTYTYGDGKDLIN